MFNIGTIGYAVGVAPVFHTKSVDLDGSTEYMANTSLNTFGIADNWSTSCWVNIPNTGSFETLLNIQTSSGNRANELFSYKDSNEKYVFRLYNSSGTHMKFYTSAGTISGKVFLGATWDGASNSLNIYIDGVNVTSGATKAVDGTGTMADSTRKIFLGTDSSIGSKLNGKYAKRDLWNTTLSDAEFLALYDSGDGYKLDTRLSKGSYTSTANLKHQWALGKETGTNIGKDYVSSGNINVSDNSSNVTDSDIVNFV